MGTTQGGLPYPVGTDFVVNGDDAIKALAEALDPRVSDTGWLTTGIVLKAPFTSGVAFLGWQSLAYRRIGRQVRINGGVNAPAAWGANAVVLTMPVGLRPASKFYGSGDQLTGIIASGDVSVGVAGGPGNLGIDLTYLIP